MISRQQQECIESLLQRDIQITCNNKILRKGIFILYTVKDYYIKLGFDLEKESFEKSGLEFIHAYY